MVRPAGFNFTMTNTLSMLDKDRIEAKEKTIGENQIALTEHKSDVNNKLDLLGGNKATIIAISETMSTTGGTGTSASSVEASVLGPQAFSKG